MSETHGKRTLNARETHGLEAQCDCELDSPGPMSDAPIEERLSAWTEWAGYLEQRIRDHYRPRIATLESDLLQANDIAAWYRSEYDMADQRAKQAERERDAATALAEDFRKQMQLARKRAEKAEAELAESRSYADKLAAGLPCLPKDVELLREGNAAMAAEVSNLNDECVRLTELMERAERLAVEEGVKRAEAEAELDEMSRAYHESDEHKAADELRGTLGECEDKLVKAEAKLSAKDAIIADLKRIVGKQEEDIAALEMRVRELGCLKVCGTCSHFDSFGSATYCSIECPERIHAHDHQRPYDSDCQYTPSRWENAFEVTP